MNEPIFSLWWHYPATFALLLVLIFLRWIWDRRVRETARFETIFDFLPEDEHARVYRALEMEHLERDTRERRRRAIDLGSRALLKLVRLGYQVGTERERRASKRKEVPTHDQRQHPFEPRDDRDSQQPRQPGSGERTGRPAQPGSDDGPQREPGAPGPASGGTGSRRPS